MPAHQVVLLQSDPGTAQSLIVSLCKSFPSIYKARSFDDLKKCMTQNHTQVAILDLALASISDVAHLCHEFPGVGVICNHRLADDEIWLAALKAGAADCCSSGYPQS